MDTRQAQAQPSGGSVARRGVLAGVGAAVAGLVAKRTTTPAIAGDDGDLILNTTNTGTATTNFNRSSGDVLRLTTTGSVFAAIVGENDMAGGYGLVGASNAGTGV